MDHVQSRLGEASHSSTIRHLLYDQRYGKPRDKTAPMAGAPRHADDGPLRRPAVEQGPVLTLSGKPMNPHLILPTLAEEIEMENDKSYESDFEVMPLRDGSGRWAIYDMCGASNPENWSPETDAPHYATREEAEAYYPHLIAKYLASHAIFRGPRPGPTKLQP